MAQPYVGEIRMFAGTFNPSGWAFCEGQLLPISENETLFQLLGTTYGGDGQSTFALPNLTGRVPIHQGNSFILAETGGVESVTLTIQQIPSHNHAMLGSTDIANSPNPGTNVVARSGQVNALISSSPTVPMSPQFLGPDGGSQPHNNFQPYLCINFIISLFGIFPSPS
jgi:microcystin-dependent protein